MEYEAVITELASLDLLDGGLGEDTPSFGGCPRLCSLRRRSFQLRPTAIVTLQRVQGTAGVAPAMVKKILANWRAFRAEQHQWFAIADTRAEFAAYASAR